MEREEWGQRARADLERACELRRAGEASGARLRAMVRGRRRERMRELHGALWGSASSARAADFFLDDVYPERAQEWRDAQALRALGSMARLMPMSALEALGEAARLDELTEGIDAGVQGRLARMGWGSAGEEPAGGAGEGFGEACDKAAWMGGPSESREQREALGRVARALVSAARLPFARQALGAMRLPARLAGLSGLQGFLERGLGAFAGLGDARGFCEGLVEREEQGQRELDARFSSRVG